MEHTPEPQFSSMGSRLGTSSLVHSCALIRMQKLRPIPDLKSQNLHLTDPW